MALDMTEHIYRIICDCNIEILKELIHKWWEEEAYSKKELIEDSLPKRFHVTFRKGHYRGESKIRVICSIGTKDTQSILKIYVLFPEWSPLYPYNTVREVVCWFVSSLRKGDIKVEVKRRLFRKKIVCP